MNIVTVVALFGIMMVIIQTLIGVIYLGVRGDIKDIKKMVESFSKDLFDRMRKVETSVESLWTEHRIKSKQCGECDAHLHTRVDDIKPEY